MKHDTKLISDLPQVHRCDICIALATRCERDIQQITCEECGHSDCGWAHWKPASEWRYGCDNHIPQYGSILTL